MLFQKIIVYKIPPGGGGGGVYSQLKAYHQLKYIMSCLLFVGFN